MKEKNNLSLSKKNILCSSKALGVLLIIFISSCSSTTDSEETEEFVPKYNLNTSVSPSEAGTVEPGDGEYEEGTIIELKATANVNWEFDEWDGDLSGNLNPAPVAMSSNKNVTARFVKREFTLTVNTVGDGEVEQEIIQSKTTEYPHGSRVLLTAIPDDNWIFSNWDGFISDENKSVEVVINRNIEITAVFKEGITDAEGNDYEIIEIGDQVWMSENLKTSSYSDGSPIPNISDNSDWQDNNSIGAWAYYNNEDANNDKFGKLYNWFAVNNSRRLCPQGWRMPSVQDWQRLEDNLGSNAGGKLKSTNSDYWSSPNSGANNESGFNARGGGKREADGIFNNLKTTGYWWSSSNSGQDNAWLFILFHDKNDATIDSRKKSLARSVRCVKN